MGLRLERAALLAPPFRAAGLDAAPLEDLSAGFSAGFSLAEGDSFEDAASALVSDFASLPSLPFSSLAFSSLAFVSVSFVSLGASSGRSAKLRWLSLSPLKSVSYQPPPLSLKTGADISRVSCDLPQCRHFLSVGSLTFCMASNSWPQLLH